MSLKFAVSGLNWKKNDFSPWFILLTNWGCANLRDEGKGKKMSPHFNNLITYLKKKLKIPQVSSSFVNNSSDKITRVLWL